MELHPSPVGRWHPHQLLVKEHRILDGTLLNPVSINVDGISIGRSHCYDFQSIITGHDNLGCEPCRRSPRRRPYHCPVPYTAASLRIAVDVPVLKSCCVLMLPPPTLVKAFLQTSLCPSWCSFLEPLLVSRIDLHENLSIVVESFLAE